MDSIQNDQKFLLKSTAFNLIGTCLKVVGPVLTIVVARVFGKEIFGIYVSTQLFILTLCRIAVLGLDKGLHRHLPQNKVHNRAPCRISVGDRFDCSWLFACYLDRVVFQLAAGFVWACDAFVA